MGHLITRGVDQVASELLHLAGGAEQLAALGVVAAADGAAGQRRRRTRPELGQLLGEARHLVLRPPQNEIQFSSVKRHPLLLSS